MKRFETELPENYISAMVVDAKKGKFAIWMTVVATLLMIAIFAVGWLLLLGTDFDAAAEKLATENPLESLLYLIGFFVAYAAYVVLHELTHGAAYKILTKQKLTFGLTLTVAYCGVPNIYVYRRTALISLLAPFVVFNVALLVPLILVGNLLLKLVFLGLFAVHFGGCAGDLYDTALYLFKFRDKNTLMRDTGPIQTFYVPLGSPLGQKNLQKQGAEVQSEPPSENN